MKVTYEINTRVEPDLVKTMAKAEDMALFIWELQHNFWRKWKYDESDFDLDNYKEALAELLDEYHIDIDDITS